MDGGTNNTGFTWYEKGYNPDSPDSGLPTAGSTFASEAAGDHSYAFAPSYTGTNAVLIDGSFTNVTLTLTTPAAYSALSFLAASGNGAVVVGYSVTHADGTSETGTFTSPDWFDSAAPAALIANGRVDASTGAYANVDSGNPKLFGIDVTLSNAGSPVTSITLSFSSGGQTAHAGIFAVSGSSGAEFVPIAVTGYNQDMIVESTAGHAEPLNVTTATVDSGGENTGATWYERGYVATAPDTGLPTAGSTLTNSTAADEVYVLAPSYSENNAALVDAANNAVLTPATPAAYTGLAILGSSGNGAVTVDYVVTHQDNSTQTGTLTVPDWFNVTPYAFTTRGRVNVDSGGVDTLNTENPRLYVVAIVLDNTTSPVTSVALNYNSGDGHAVILALSGASGAVRPIFDVQPASTSVLAGTAAELSAAVSGALPITFQWLKEIGAGAFTNLTDGGSISGATTTNLSIANAVATDAGNYVLVASNSAGSVTSQVAQVTIISTATDVTSPGDEITSFGGTSPDAEAVANAIDDTTSKYLNFGTDGNQDPPFVGPVGLIVTPAAGSTVVTGLRLYTANDAVARDPVDFILEGSNDGGTTYTQIATGPLSLPDDRNDGGLPLDPLTVFNQEVTFANDSGYETYRLTFTNVKDNAGANSMQIGEIELLGTTGAGAPRLTVARASADSITISWSGAGTLQSTGALLGAQTQWTDAGTTSPVTVQTTESARFFRLLVQ